MRCGCSGTCTCTFKEGRGVDLSGSATKSKPLVVDMKAGGQSVVIGRVSDSVQVLVTGAGSADDPYVVTMNKLAAATPKLITIDFTAPGSYVWEKPAFGSLALVTVLGGGGGGAASDSIGEAISSNPTTARVGRGGRPGVQTLAEYKLADLGATVPITVGAGGNGAPTPAPRTGTSIGGAGNGSNGQSSTFDQVVAVGGQGGGWTTQGGGDPRTAASASQGGAGGLAKVSPWVGTDGLDGGAPVGAPASGGGGGVATETTNGEAGNSTGQLRRRQGTGGGGGIGALIGPYLNNGGAGGAGGPGAGGGGGGIGSPSGGGGGRGGNGLVRIVIQ